MTHHVVTYRTDAGVEWRRPVDSIPDIDRELRAVVDLARFHTGPAAHHPGSPRQLRNLQGLADALLDARWQWMRAEVDRCRASWWGPMVAVQEVEA